MDYIEKKQLEDFSQQLQKYIPDELQAHQDYTSLSNKAYELGLGNVANTLNLMGQDEWRHKGNLERMIAEIKQKIENEQTTPKYPIGTRVRLFGMPGTVVGQVCEYGRWRNEVMCEGSEGQLQQNWAYEEDIQPEY